MGLHKILYCECLHLIILHHAITLPSHFTGTDSFKLRVISHISSGCSFTREILTDQSFPFLVIAHDRAVSYERIYEL